MKDVLIVIGSESDRERMEAAVELMDEEKLSYDVRVFSAHRNLPELLEFLDSSASHYSVIIAAAGLSAALPGVIASRVTQPVIGVPLVAGELSGIDALLSILQLPKGIPVATMGIGKQGCLNAVHLAKRILSVRS